MSSAAASSGRPRARPRKDAASPGILARPLTFGAQVVEQQQQEQIFQHHHHHRQQQQQQQQFEQQQQEVVVECRAQMEEEEDLLAQQKKKEIKRSWREEWKVQHKWVYPIHKENGELRLKCQWCSAYNMDNVFAKEGCSTIQLSALNTHAKSEAHKTAEARWEGSAEAAAAAAAAAAISGHHLAVPDNLWDFGGGGGKASEMSHGHGDGSGDPGLEESDLNGSCGGSLSRKRRLASTAAAAAAAAAGGSARLAEALLEAEAGRSKRHAAELGLLKRQHALEDQRLRLDGERLAFERARLDAMVRLGHQYSAAMASIGSGLLKIGAALQSSAAAAPPPQSPPSREGP